MMFWVLAAVLVGLAAAFVVGPLLRGRAAGARSGSEGSGERRGLMRALYRDRVTELEAEARAGVVDAQVRAEVEEELGASLLDEYESALQREADAPSPSRSGGRRAAAWVMLVLLPLAGFGIYLSAGDPTAVDLAGASEVLRLDPREHGQALETWRSRLTRRVEAHPDDAHSWYLLGISRLQLGDFEQAADAFAAAHGLVGPDPNVMLYWLQARYLAQGGELDERSRGLAERLLERQPSQPLVLELLAIDAYRAGRFREAVEYLNRALNNPLPRAQLTAMLEGLGRARSQMGVLQPSVDVTIPAPDGAPRDATLFVIARPPGGGMPYAVVRRPAELLPLSVRLDDTVSMSPARSLSQAGAIEVVVRLSRSGRPTAEPGDWEWSSGVVDLADLAEPVELDAALAPRPAEAAQGR